MKRGKLAPGRAACYNAGKRKAVCSMVKTVGIVSLSAGTLGESFVKHELDIGRKRLTNYGLNVRFLPHALSGIEYIKTTRRIAWRTFSRRFAIRRSI